MRVALALGFLLGARWSQAAGPRAPKAADLQRLERHLEKVGQFRETRISPLLKDKHDIERRIGLRDEKGRNLRQDLSSGGRPETKEALAARSQGRTDFDEKIRLGFESVSYEERARYAEVTRKLKPLQEELTRRYNEAILLALETYAIRLKRASGPIVNGPPPPSSEDDVPSFLGRQASWNPVYGEIAEEGRFGSTDPDGRVRIAARAFDYPGRLAHVLYHESLHFERLLTPGLDLRNEPLEETQARLKAEPLLKTVFALREEDIRRHQEQLGRHERLADRWADLLAQGFNPYKKSQRAAFPGNLQRFWLEEAPSDESALEDILAEHRLQEGRGGDSLAGTLRGMSEAVKELSSARESKRETRRWLEEHERGRQERRHYLAELEASRDPYQENRE